MPSNEKATFYFINPDTKESVLVTVNIRVWDYPEGKNREYPAESGYEFTIIGEKPEWVTDEIIDTRILQ